jgi:hypothetical protein
MVDSRAARPLAAGAVVLVLAALGACARDGGGDGLSPVTSVVAPGQSRTVVADAAGVATDPLAQPATGSCPEGGGAAASMEGEDGATDAPADEPESNPADDAGGDDATRPPPAIPTAPVIGPSPGDLAITEVMFQPSGPEPEAEWFEIYNLASTPRLLSGLTIQDGFLDVAEVAADPPVVAPPGAYVLLVRDRATATANLLPDASIVYAYGTGLTPDEGIELDDGAYSDLSLWSAGVELADVPYGQWDAEYFGQSIELAQPSLLASDPSNWCLADTPWARGSDDGTPGAASDCGP